jgi:hypothetical protein
MVQCEKQGVYLTPDMYAIFFLHATIIFFVLFNPRCLFESTKHLFLFLIFDFFSFFIMEFITHHGNILLLQVCSQAARWCRRCHVRLIRTSDSPRLSDIPCRYDCKDNSDDSAPAPVKGGNAPRLMQGTVGPSALHQQGSAGSTGHLSRGGSAQVHDFSDQSDEEDEPLTAEQQLRRRLGQLGN